MVRQVPDSGETVVFSATEHGFQPASKIDIGTSLHYLIWKYCDTTQQEVICNTVHSYGFIYVFVHHQLGVLLVPSSSKVLTDTFGRSLIPELVV